MQSELKMMNVADLVPWGKNPRINDHAVEHVAKSIEEFGFAAPIVVRKEDNMVICGNTRLKAVQQLQMEKVPCHVVDLDERTAERLAIADNKIGGIATFDDVKLGELFADFDDEDFAGLGFSDSEIGDLLDFEEEPSEESTAPPQKVNTDLNFTLLKGNCLERLKELPDGSVDSIVTDPPYHLMSVVQRYGKEGSAPAKHGSDGLFQRQSAGFMGQTWDGVGEDGKCIAFNVELWKECLRVLKHGGYLVAFSATRTVFRMGVAIEDAGFELRDTIHWIYESGFPKSMDLSKAIDKHLGKFDERKVVGMKEQKGAKFKLTEMQFPNGGFNDPNRTEFAETAPATPEAESAVGIGTALKPACEPAILARKPLDGNYAENFLKYGTSGLNIDECRFAYGEKDNGWFGNNDPSGSRNNKSDRSHSSTVHLPPKTLHCHDLGRWPANVYLCAKASRSEREAGLKHLIGKSGSDAVERKEGSAGLNNPRAGAGRTANEVKNFHPTVKPLRLMKWLIKLVTPKNGTVLDPFLGSGTTAAAAIIEGRNAIGCEMTEDYFPIIEGRVEHAKRIYEGLIDEDDKD